jgi:Trypsin
MSPFDEMPSLVLDRLADRADYAIVGPTDGRTRVLQTSRPPYAAVCQIERDFGDGRLSGCSGFLVAPNVLVTAAHCVFSRPRHLLLGRGAPRRIRVTPARNGTGPPPLGYQWAVRWYAHRRFVERGDVMYDFGLVVTPRPFRALPSVFPLSAPDDARLCISPVIPATSPRARCGSTPSGSTASGSARSITASTPVPDIPAARCGFSGIVPAMSMPSPSMWPGRCRTNAALGAAGRACRSRRRAPSIAASA